MRQTTNTLALALLLLPAAATAALTPGSQDPADGQQSSFTAGKPGQGAADLDAFRDYATEDPARAAGALARLMGSMPEEQRQDFRDRNCGKIVEVLIGLDRLSGAGTLSAERYDGIAGQLAPFNIPTFATYGNSGGGMMSLFAKADDEDPLLALVKTRITMKEGNLGKSEAAIGRVTGDFPSNASAQAAAAAYYAELHNFAMAERTASASIALDSSSPDAYKTRALARNALEDRKGAIEDIKRVTALDPHDESAKILSALIHSRKPVQDLKTLAELKAMKRQLGLPDGTLDAVSSGMGELPEDAPGVSIGGGPADGAGADQVGTASARARAYLKTAAGKNRIGDHDGALSYATLAIEKDPACLDAYLERANANNFLGRFDDAVRDTSFVIEKDPRNMQAYNMRAWALNRNGKSTDAESDASRAIGINPNFADAWFNRALSYEKQGDYKRMLEDFRQAAALSGEYSTRYQDAVAQYGPRVPGFNPAAPAAARVAEPGGETEAAPARSPLRRFLLLLVFTLTGGGLVALGLVHIITGQNSAAARASHPDVLAPSVFYEGVATGKYKIEKKVGEGAMGQVYLATDQSLGRKVAVKRMNEEIKVNEREKQRFLDEARTVAMLHHPNIVEIHTIFEEEGDIYLVFEYVEGTPFDKLVEKEARLTFGRARPLFEEVAKALSYAHSKGVVHRDLKLANVMLTAEGGVKVMDFGLARPAREAASQKEIVGSPAYMAPEQELGASTPRSDLYALGVCLYEALSGVLPFQGPDFHAQKSRMACQPLTQSVPGLPPAVDELIAKCLAPDPDKRFRSADEFRSALAAIEL